jgi:hypothetical protein
MVLLDRAGSLGLYCESQGGRVSGLGLGACAARSVCKCEDSGEPRPGIHLPGGAGEFNNFFAFVVMAMSAVVMSESH